MYAKSYNAPVYWLVVLRTYVYVGLAMFQPYPNLKVGDGPVYDIFNIEVRNWCKKYYVTCVFSEN